MATETKLTRLALDDEEMEENQGADPSLNDEEENGEEETDDEHEEDDESEEGIY